MPRPYKPYIPRNLGALSDLLGSMILGSPTFIDRTGYFPHRNIETVFFSMNEGLKLLRETFGEDRYLLLRNMSDRMRAHFEADSEGITDETWKGRDILDEMEGLLKQTFLEQRDQSS